VSFRQNALEGHEVRLSDKWQAGKAGDAKIEDPVVLPGGAPQAPAMANAPLAAFPDHHARNRT